MNRTPVQNAARLVGLAFLLIGLAGFIPGITTNLYGGLEFAGDKGDAEVLGLFEVSVLHNIVHWLFGIAGFALAATASGARTFLIGGGAIYLLLAGIQVIDAGEWVPLVGADLWLHLVLGAGMVGLGYALTREPATP